MARIGILNFPGHMNQGANLTAYALQKVLQDWGHEAVNLHLRNNYRPEKEPIYTDFADANIRITSQSAVGETSMQIFNSQFDTFIVGSDQVWRNTSESMFTWKTCMESCFHLAFAAPGKRRIAVAASFGRDEYNQNPEVRRQFAQELRRFTAISVREKSGVEILKEIGDFETTVLIDPVFYIDEKQWYQFADAKRYEGRSLMAYNAFFHQEEVHLLQKEMSDEFDFVDVCTGNTAQWLAYIRDARFVVTDSFHVCCFCLIFGTPFACLSNAGFGRARFEELAETFHFSKERIIDSDKVENLAEEVRRLMLLPYDTAEIKQAILQGREKAHVWLKSALAAPVPAWSGPDFVWKSRKEIREEQMANNLWKRHYLSQRNLRIARILLRISPFFRKKLRAKIEKHELLLRRYSW